ncbi:hypothetical protein GCM10010182_04150 [Actinomadura cremea]|nr:hypothetical protein GCM10010182_04150 [Actinomadura cremea]
MRSVLFPSDASTARPVAPWRARWRLRRLGRALRRAGWIAELRDGARPVLLRVYSPNVLCLGDSITVVAGPGGCWFQSSTGRLLAPCGRVGHAVTAAGAVLTPIVRAALGDDA